MELELIDRNLLILRLKQLEVNISGFIRPSRANYLRNAVEDFICTEIVNLVREQPCIKLDEKLEEKMATWSSAGMPGLNQLNIERMV